MAARLQSSLADIRRQQEQERRVVNHNPLYSDSEDEDDLEERFLSEQHGEAQEDGKDASASRKDSGKDANLEELYKAKRQRKPRPTVTEQDLKSAEKGLLCLMDYDAKQYAPSNAKDIPGAARYTSKIIQHISDFCRQIQPNIAVDEAVAKIEALSTKKEVKDYVQHLRTRQRDQYLEKIYGKYEAESMIEELEGIHARKQQEEEDYISAMRQVVGLPTTAQQNDATIGQVERPQSLPPQPEISPMNTQKQATSSPRKRSHSDLGQETLSQESVPQNHRLVLQDSSDEEEDQLEFSNETSQGSETLTIIPTLTMPTQHE